MLDLGAEDSNPVAAEWEPPGLEEVARLFPTWKVQSLLGRGGMGVVYLMHQPELDRSVAVKLLPLEACREERQVERFRREARTLAKLQHPNIVALHEAGITPDGHFFFVMEYVEGLPLSQLIASGNVMVPKALEIVRQVCDALAVAHAAGVVHRDIKPSNILIDQQGQVKVAEMLALPHQRHDHRAPVLCLSGELGRPGVIVGRVLGLEVVHHQRPIDALESLGAGKDTARKRRRGVVVRRDDGRPVVANENH